MVHSKPIISKFNKTNYLNFTAKRNMSINLQICVKDNLITNSSYTKFLRVTMDNTLSLKHHIYLLIKKWSMACYIIRYAKTYMSASSLKMICPAFFHSAMSKGIIFWGNSLHRSTIFDCRKQKLKLWKDVGIEFHVHI